MVTRPAPYDAARRARRRHRTRTLLWRWRVPVACAALGTAASLVVGAVRPPPEPSRPALVLTRDAPAGESLDRSVAVVRLPEGVGPSCALTDARAVAGDSLVVALPAGTVLCATLLASSSPTAVAPEGTVVVPVTLSDPHVAAALSPGDHVNLVASGGAAGTTGATDGATTAAEGAARVVARRALVLPGGTPARTSTGGLLGGAPSPQDGVTTVLVAVDPDEGVALVAASASGYVGAVIVR